MGILDEDRTDLPAGPFHGFNREGAKISPGAIDNWRRQGMTGDAKAHCEGVKAFSETDQTADLKTIGVEVLAPPGGGDQIVPIDTAGRLSVDLVQNGALKVYGFPHGMLATHAGIINPDLLAFVES